MEIGLKIVKLPMWEIKKPLKQIGVIISQEDLEDADYTLAEGEEIILPEEYIEHCPLGRNRAGVIKVNIKFINEKGTLKTEKLSQTGNVCRNCPLADVECFQKGYITEEELKKSLMSV